MNIYLNASIIPLNSVPIIAILILGVKLENELLGIYKPIPLSYFYSTI